MGLYMYTKMQNKIESKINNLSEIGKIESKISKLSNGVTSEQHSTIRFTDVPVGTYRIYKIIKIPTPNSLYTKVSFIAKFRNDKKEYYEAWMPTKMSKDHMRHKADKYYLKYDGFKESTFEKETYEIYTNKDGKKKKRKKSESVKYNKFDYMLAPIKDDDKDYKEEGDYESNDDSSDYESDDSSDYESDDSSDLDELNAQMEEARL